MMGFLNTPVINPLHHACYSHSKRLSDFPRSRRVFWSKELRNQGNNESKNIASLKNIIQPSQMVGWWVNKKGSTP